MPAARPTPRTTRRPRVAAALVAFFAFSAFSSIGAFSPFAADLDVASPLRASRARADSWDAVAQTGGFLGALGAGLSYNGCGEACRVRFVGGYTPPGIAGRDVFDLSLRLGYAPGFARVEAGGMTLAPHVSAGAVYNPDPRLWVDAPGRYGTKYYPPTAVHAVGGVGIDLVFPRRAAHGGSAAPTSGASVAFLDVVAHQTPLVALVSNRGSVPLGAVFTYALGYARRFDL